MLCGVMHRPLLALAAALLATAANADTLISNVNGLQVGPDGKLQHFTGLIVSDGGKVVRTLGPADDVGVKGRIINGGGRTLLPGLIDAHGHVTDLGFAALRIDVTGTHSIGELQQRLRDYAAAHPNDAWILGFGWNQELWTEKRFPTSADLDAAVSARPVVLERVDGHAVVANSAALKAAGVTAATKAPPGGEIHDGVFVDAARSLVDKAVPKPTAEQQDAALTKSQEILLGYGVTGVGAMSASVADWTAFRRAGQGGRLHVRIMSYLFGT